MPRCDPSRVPLVMTLLLAAGLAASLGSPPARADPFVTDNGNGTRTAMWNFSNAPDYVLSNVAVGPGGLALRSTPGFWLQSSDGDFAANGTPDPSVTITGGSLRLGGHEGNLVANGDFSSSGTWTYENGTTGAVTASRNLGSGELRHQSNNNSTQYDAMDVVGTWMIAGSGGATSQLRPENGIKVEGMGSVRDTISLSVDTEWAGLAKSIAADFSPYNRLSLWLNTSFGGPGQLSAVLHLEAGAPNWTSAPLVLRNSWQRVEFDFTPFGRNLSSLLRLELRFTGAAVASTDVYIDDIWRLYRKTVDETASISQTFAKSWASSGQPGSILLRWDSTVPLVTNVILASFDVTVENSAMTRQSWTADYTSPEAWTTRSMDLSVLMAPADVYSITFSLRVAIDSHLATAATARIDNVVLRALDYTSGAYTSNALNAGSAVVWGSLSWTCVEDAQTGVGVETRSGSTAAPGDPTWSPWLSHPASGEPIASPNSRFLQFRVLLMTYNSSRTPALLDLTLGFSRFVTLGYVETRDSFVPPEPLVGWRRFEAANSAPVETSVQYEVSEDGVFWATVDPGDDLSGYHGPGIRVRAWLSTENTSLSPRIASMAVTYEYVGPLWTATLDPPSWSGTADESRTFIARGFDHWSHPVPFSPTWETTDPTGTVTNGVYDPGTAGVHVVRVRGPSGAILANATVTVGPGALARIALNASAGTAPVGSQVSFSARGFDAHDNDVTLTATLWSTDGGTFINETAAGAVLRLPGIAGTVTVTARHGPFQDSERVTVTDLGAPVIQGTVPAQVHPEDSTWDLDLTAFAQSQPNPANTLANLSWCITGKDDALYSVWGEHFAGNHHLVFSAMPDATGTDDVYLWLKNATGAAASQPLQIAITPVNDPPYFDSVPDLPVKAGTPYTFDVSPYIVDVDTPPADLTLTAGDPEHVGVAGLNLTLRYGQDDLDRKVYLRLAVSDGEHSAQTVVIVTVTTNTPPHVQIPLPDLTLLEDAFLPRAFPRSLSEYFADEDGDDLFFSYGQRDVTVTIWNNASFWQVDVRPDPDWNGVERVTFRATDSRHAFAEYSIYVTVLPVNDAPTFTWRDDLYTRFDAPYALDLSAYIRDVDTPIERVTLAASPSHFAQVQRLVATLLFPRFLLGPAPSYTVPVTFYVNDTEPGPVRQVLVHVSDNAPPILLRSLPDVAFDEDTTHAAYRLDDYFHDPDDPGASLQYTFSGANVTADIAADSTVTFGTAAAHWNGQELVRFRAEDEGGAFVVTSIDVRVVPVNDPPRFVQPILDIDLTDAHVAVIDLRTYVEDVDNNVDTLNYTVLGAHATVYGYILILDYPASAPSELVRVTVSDGVASASTSFEVTVRQPTFWAQIFWPWSGIGILLAGIAVFVVWELFLRFPHTLEDMFVIGRDGRLILHNTRRLRADRDEDILAGMLTAIMMFVRDSFREEQQDLNQFELKDRKVLVERGTHCYVAAIYAGKVPPWARSDIAAFLRDIEGALGRQLEAWSGDKEDLQGLKGMTEEFVRSRRYEKGRSRPGPRQAP